MSKNDFSRINVDVRSLNVSAPGRSGFDLTKSSAQSVPFGKLFPVRCTKLIPTSTLKGSVSPDLQLEKFATPAAGRMRLDTHTFIVAAKRIHSGFKQFIESGMVGRTAQNLPSFTLFSLVDKYSNAYLLPKEYLTSNVWSDILTYFSQGAYYQTHFNPSLLFVAWLGQLQDPDFGEFIKYTPQNLPTYLKNIADYFSVERERLSVLHDALKNDRENRYPNQMYGGSLTPEQVTALENQQYYIGDFVYDLLLTLFGEGSTLDQLGYPIISYFGSIRENMNRVDKDLRSHVEMLGSTPGTWDATSLAKYIAAFEDIDFSQALAIVDYSVDSEGVYSFVRDMVMDVNLSEMPLRANYAVWFDYFRDWHLDPETSCPNPDDFGSTSYLNNIEHIMSLLVLRHRNWSRDGFTMVQPDDVYRHIYAPAMNKTDYSSMVSDDGSFDAFDNDYFTIKAGAVGEFNLPFPSTFTSIFGGKVSQTTYYHDLQTMRRTEMLKRKVTRDYYNPDTYVGQFVARWGVEPADFAIMCTQYLGGNETMISGEQVTSPVETENTTLGQRTMVANASSNDSFTYNMSEHSYLLSYVSIVPLVHYDALNPTLQEISVHDQVIPEYANDNQVVIRACDLVRDLFGIGYSTGLGYVPRFYGYRMALDDAHGKFLREYRSYIWLRDRYTSGNSMLTKNAINAHINMPLDCFIGLREWDTIAFGNIQLPLYVECPLPDKLENV